MEDNNTETAQMVMFTCTCNRHHYNIILPDIFTLFIVLQIPKIIELTNKQTSKNKKGQGGKQVISKCKCTCIWVALCFNYSNVSHQ